MRYNCHQRTDLLIFCQIKMYYLTFGKSVKVLGVCLPSRKAQKTLFFPECSEMFYVGRRADTVHKIWLRPDMFLYGSLHPEKDTNTMQAIY
jgi:hypothetical protein